MTSSSASSLPAPDAALVEKLAIANRILYHEGVVDGFGHVSVRHDGSAAHFLLARNMAPALVTPADILTFDLDRRSTPATGASISSVSSMARSTARGRTS